jgi:hypothetical protein
VRGLSEPRVAAEHVAAALFVVVRVPQKRGVRGEDVAVLRGRLGRPLEVAGGALLVAVHVPDQLGVLRQELAVVGVGEYRTGVVLLCPPVVPFNLKPNVQVPSSEFRNKKRVFFF